MQYHIAKDGVKSGPFEKEEIYRRLGSGELSGSDLGWCEGMSEWEPLSKLLPPPGATPAFARGSVMAGTFPSAAPVNSGAAIASLVCGILGFILWLPCIPAVILGHISLSAIKKSAGALTGRGMAITGLVMGYLMIAAIPIVAVAAAIAIPSFAKVSMQANQIKAVNNAKQIVIAMKMYASDNDGNYPPTLDALIEEGILNDRKLFQFPPAMDVPGQEWDYRGAGPTDSEPGNLIVLTSRMPDRTGTKIIARNDGSVQVERADQLH